MAQSEKIHPQKQNRIIRIENTMKSPLHTSYRKKGTTVFRDGMETHVQMTGFDPTGACSLMKVSDNPRAGLDSPANCTMLPLLYMKRSVNALEAKRILYRVRQWYI